MNAETKLVKQVLESNHVTQVSEESNLWSLLWSCTSLNHKPHVYDGMLESQKTNHFLNSTELTKKDRLVINFMKMRNQFGPEEFNFLPESYVLPEEAT
jgi:tubulin polyglutamylase TTLL4